MPGGPVRLAGPAAISLALLGAVTLPFDVGLPPFATRWTLLDRLSVAWHDAPMASLNAFNLWPLLLGGGEARGIGDATPGWFGLTYQSWGSGLALVAIGLTLGRLWRRPTRGHLVWASLALVLACYVLPTRLHDRYLLPAVLLAALNPAYRLPAATLSFTLLANLVAVHVRYAAGDALTAASARPWRGPGPTSGGSAPAAAPGEQYHATFQPTAQGAVLWGPLFGDAGDRVTAVLSALNVLCLVAVLVLGYRAERATAGPAATPVEL